MREIHEPVSATILQVETRCFWNVSEQPSSHPLAQASRTDCDFTSTIRMNVAALMPPLRPLGIPNISLTTGEKLYEFGDLVLLRLNDSKEAVCRARRTAWYFHLQFF